MKSPLEIGTKAMIHGKQWTVTEIWNVTQPGSVGEDELLYVFEGWGDVNLKLVEWEVANLIDDGEFKVL